MRRSLKAAVVALALAGGALTLSPARAAEVGISINPGGVAFGYNDGYWDRNHRWHAWRRPSDADWYRTHYAEHYYDWRHDRDNDRGWHGNDRWWTPHG